MARLNTPIRTFGDHEANISAVAVFPDRQRIVTGSGDKTLRLWDLKTGTMLKKMEGHQTNVNALAVAQNGKLIASGDESGEVIAWHGETGDSLTLAVIKAHNSSISSLDFSPDGSVLATGSSEDKTKLWGTTAWHLQGKLNCGADVSCVRYSPAGAGELLAIASSNQIEIWNPRTERLVALLKGHESYALSLVWTPDGTRLLSAGDSYDPTIREWDTSTWNQVGPPWEGHTEDITSLAVNASGTIVASASIDNYICIWQLPLPPVNLKHTSSVQCVAFSMDGKHILSGGSDNKISEWAVSHKQVAQDSTDLKILAINTAVRDACIKGDLHTAEVLLTQEIDADSNTDYDSYANRSIVMVRKFDWDHALDDAIKSISIQPSLIGYISKGLALCRKQQLFDATKAFDFAFTYTNGDPKLAHYLFLIKAVALFNANAHEEAVLPVQELAARPNADPLACRIVEACLRLQLGNIATNGALHREAADHFTAAVNASASFSKLDVHSMYEDLALLFGWDLKSLWQTVNQQRCHALVGAGDVGSALEACLYMMDMSDERTKASFRAWIPALNGERSTLYITD